MLTLSYLVGSVIYIFLPMAFLWVLTRPVETLREHNFRQAFAMNFFNLDERSKYKLFYMFTFILRRIFFVGTGFTFSEYGGIQIICLNYLNLL